MSLLCRHETGRLEQKVKGRQETQKIMDKVEVERVRKEFPELQAHRYIVIYAQ